MLPVKQSSSQLVKSPVHFQNFLPDTSLGNTDVTSSNPIFSSKLYGEEIAIKEIPIDESSHKRWCEEIKELVDSSPLQKNLSFARAICKEVRKHIPKGTNTEKDGQKSLLTFNEKVKTIQTLRTETQQKVNALSQLYGVWPTPEQIYAICYEEMKKYGFGQCGELTKAAFIEAQKNPEIQDLSYCLTTIGKHAFLVIGKMTDASAVICDVWADKCYSLHEFREMQKIEHDVKYAKEYYLPKNVWLFTNKKAPAPYLAGDIDVQHSWCRN